MALNKKQKLTPAELEEKKQKEAKQKAYEEAIYKLPSTFTLITGQRLLAKLGVSMPQDNLSIQIQKPNTYYHALLYAAAKRTLVHGYIERCRDIQAYGQQKLIHYLFSGEAGKEEEEKGNEAREVIEISRVKMVDMGKKFVAFEDDCIERTATCFNELSERAEAWYRTVASVMTDLMAYLNEKSVEVTPGFSSAFNNHLLETSAGVVLTQAQKTKYHCTDDVDKTIVEKTVISLTESLLDASWLSAEGLDNMRSFFSDLDKRMRADYDSLTGFNASEKEVALTDVEFMEESTQNFQKEIVLISQRLFKYYAAYASDNSLQVDVEEAFEFGVDESVADDYKAIRV